MRRQAIGVVRHEVHLDQGVPVSVTLVLADETEVVVDLAGHRVTGPQDPPLTLKRQAWLWQIGEYLARQHLLEVEQQQRDSRVDGRQELLFEPRPDPKLIWWG